MRLPTTVAEDQPTGLDVIELRVSGMAPDRAKDFVLETMNAIDFYKTRIREIEAAFKPKLIEYIKQNGPLVCGTVRYYLGRRKITKCSDRPGALDALFTACGGDFGKVVEGLSSDAFKPGWAKATLPAEVYEKCFATVYQDELKDDEVEATLQRIDTAFVK